MIDELFSWNWNMQLSTDFDFSVKWMHCIHYTLPFIFSWNRVDVAWVRCVFSWNQIIHLPIWTFPSNQFTLFVIHMFFFVKLKFAIIDFYFSVKLIHFTLLFIFREVNPCSLNVNVANTYFYDFFVTLNYWFANLNFSVKSIQETLCIIFR